VENFSKYLVEVGKKAERTVAKFLVPDWGI
jgi:hypothetical protein